MFLLVGCTKISIKMETFVAKIDAKFENMLTISNQELTNYYEIDLTKFKDYVFKVSSNSPTNIYVLVLPNNKKEAKKEIEKFFDLKAKNSSQTDKTRIKNKYDNTYGDYLFYIVSDKSREIYKEMNEFINNE